MITTKLFIYTIFFIALIYLTNSFKINSSNKHFIDEKGRAIILHGVNVVYKLPPYIPVLDKFDPFNSFSIEDISHMKSFGFNFVRLGVIWESVEISPGVYDHEYLEKMNSLINLMGENGIKVLVDAHQDMFSRIFCGEGVPHFYAKLLTHEAECKTNLLSRVMRLVGACIPLKTFNWRYDNEGLPLIEDCRTGFLKFHQSPELTSIYASFYNNELGMQDKFAAFWKILAQKFKNNPYVVGYDLWNEPWPGNLWSDMKSMWPGNSDHYQVLPFYKKIDKAIREVQPDYINFFESVPFPDTLPFFGGKVLGEFIETPAGQEHLNHQVLNWHSYCCQARADACATGEPTYADSLDLCPKYHRMKIKAHREASNKLGVPMIVTEFGACSNSLACYNEMKGFVEAAEENFVSWAYWMYKPFGDHTTTASEHTEGIFLDTGKPQELKLKALSRPYVQAYQGIPVSNFFDPERAYYKSSFVYDKNILAPTVVYFNKDFFYQEGHFFKVTDEDGKDVDYDLDNSEINGNDVNYFAFKIRNENMNKENPIITLEVIRK